MKGNFLFWWKWKHTPGYGEVQQFSTTGRKMCARVRASKTYGERIIESDTSKLQILLFWNQDKNGSIFKAWSLQYLLFENGLLFKPCKKSLRKIEGMPVINLNSHLLKHIVSFTIVQYWHRTTQILKQYAWRSTLHLLQPTFSCAFQILRFACNLRTEWKATNQNFLGNSQNFTFHFSPSFFLEIFTQ